MNYLLAGLCIPLLASCSMLPPDGDAQGMRTKDLGPQNAYQSNMKAQNQSQTHTPIITQTGTITEESKTILQNAYSEELLARDIYTYMVSKYSSLANVVNTVNSEKRHNDSIGALLDAYGISRPTDYRIYSDTYTTLKNMIDSSLTGAIEVGIMVETGDIDHLLAEYKKVDNPDIRRVFENIGGGSFNHLRAFLREAQAAGYTPKTDTSKYLTANDLNTRGPLNDKMTELLKVNNLPTYSTGAMHNEGAGNGNGGGRGMGGGNGGVGQGSGRNR